MNYQKFILILIDQKEPIFQFKHVKKENPMNKIKYNYSKKIIKPQKKKLTKIIKNFQKNIKKIFLI